MVDIVDEEVELHLIDTRQLVKEAKKLKEAQRISEQSKKVKKELTFGGPSASIQAGDQGLVPGAEAKRQTRVGAVKGQNTFSAFTAMQKKIKQLEKKQKKLRKDVVELPNKILGKIDEAKSLLNASTTPAGTLGIFTGIASRFGPVGIIVAAIVATLIPTYFDQYERGGIFSTKLPITEKEKNIADIDFVVDVRSGTKYLTSDLRIAQKAPDTSNTLNLRYEHIRYNSQELGK